MSEVRMSLAEAGELLGIKPNSLRSRFKAGKIQGERDNSGKIWVLLDPEKLANDKGSKRKVSKPSIEPFEANEIKALNDHIETLAEQLKISQSEVETLRSKADNATRLEGEANGLKAQISLLEEQSKQHREDAKSAIDKLLALQSKPQSLLARIFRR